jgi:hypothetical protein
MPTKGIFAFNYYSGDGKGLDGCRPIVCLRKALLNLVLVDEDDMIEENLRSKPIDKNKPPIMIGERCFQSLIGKIVSAVNIVFHGHFISLVVLFFSRSSLLLGFWDSYLCANTSSQIKKK